MTSKEIIDKLREDKHYYGEFGQQYLSNSNISTLLENPLALREPQKQIPAFLVGGYFHTAILEPEKLRSFKVIEADAVVKGQTAASSAKPALLDNGIRTTVPPHIETGTRVIINTEDGSYIERAKD